MVAGLTFENPIFANFAFYAAICVGKMMLMTFLTARVRFAKRVSREEHKNVNRNLFVKYYIFYNKIKMCYSAIAL